MVRQFYFYLFIVTDRIELTAMQWTRLDHSIPLNCRTRKSEYGWLVDENISVPIQMIELCYSGSG